MKRLREETVKSGEAPPVGGATEIQHEARRPQWDSLNIDLLAEAMTFCNAVDLLSLRRTCSVFRQAARLAVARAEALHLSALHATNAEGRKQNQEPRVTCLLEDSGRLLRNLDISGLEHIQGGLGGPLRRCQNLTSLCVRECTNLDPRLFQTAIESSTANLIHLDASACSKVDVGVVRAIAAKWRDLESLHLGLTSMTIDDDCFELLSRNLRKLRALDLTHLNQLTHVSESHLLSLSPSLECLYLPLCHSFQFPVLGEIAQQTEPTFSRLLQEGNLTSLANRVKSGDVDEVWSVIEPGMDIHSRELLAGNPTNGLLKSGWRNLRVLDLCLCGRLNGGTGVPRGVVGFLGMFSGGALRELNISGCSNVADLDVKILAASCGKSLTSFVAISCNIGDGALKGI